MTFKSLSIKKKLSHIILSSICAVLLLSGIMFLGNDLYTFRDKKIHELDDLAKLIGQASVVPLAFKANGEVTQILSSLEERQHIKSLFIFDKTDSLFAKYNSEDFPEGDMPEFIAELDEEDFEFSSFELKMVRAINWKKEFYGTVYIVEDLWYVLGEISWIILISLSILIVSSILVFLFSFKLQAYISQPIVNLANTVKLLSEKGDYSIRAKKETDDEIGFLTERFNEMLSQIQCRDDALQTAHDNAQRQTLEVESELVEKRRAEKALRVSEERFRDLFDNAPDIYIILKPDGTISDFNKKGLRLLGYEMDDVVGQSLSKFISEEDIFSLNDIIDRITKYEIIPQNCEARILYENGRTCWTSVQFSILENEAHEIQFLRIIFRDITERKKLRDELERAQRLETAGRIASQIAHDFNNLLGPLAAYPVLIRDDLDKGKDVSPMLDEMEMAAIKIADINQQLLTLGRRGHYNTASIDVNSLLEKIMETPLLSKYRFEADLGSNLFLIEGGGAQLLRALTNLMINAVESMNKKGILLLKTHNTYLNKKLSNYSSVKTGNYVQIDITDQGCGIPTAIKNKIFEPFFTTKTMDKMRGSGLGLSVVHGVVADHEGYITVESEVEKGSTFSVYLPVSTKTQTDVQVVSPKITGGNEAILIVDDDPGQRKVIRFLLKRLGYKVEEVTSGEEAISYVKKYDADLLILDMVMGKIDGTEAYQEILKINPQQKAIMLSGYAMTKRVQEAIKLGAGGFVSKPVSFLELANVVREELDNTSDKDDKFTEAYDVEVLQT